MPARRARGVAPCFFGLGLAGDRGGPKATQTPTGNPDNGPSRQARPRRLPGTPGQEPGESPLGNCRQLKNPGCRLFSSTACDGRFLLRGGTENGRLSARWNGEDRRITACAALKTVFEECDFLPHGSGAVACRGATGKPCGIHGITFNAPDPATANPEAERKFERAAPIMNGPRFVFFGGSVSLAEVRGPG
jgi:hypothetical protein